MPGLKKMLFVSLLSLLVFPSIASSHDNTDPRHIAMEALGQNMKALKRNLKAGAISPEMQKQGAEIHAIAQRLTALFPEGPQKPDSRAKPEIWADFAAFEKENDRFVAAAVSFAAALKSGDVSASQAAQKITGKSCGGCHKVYRFPKK